MRQAELHQAELQLVELQLVELQLVELHQAHGRFCKPPKPPTRLVGLCGLFDDYFAHAPGRAISGRPGRAAPGARFWAVWAVWAVWFALLTYALELRTRLV